MAASPAWRIDRPTGATTGTAATRGARLRRMSRVSQTLKFGYQGGYLESDATTFTNTHNLAYRVNNGVPNQLTQNLNPFLAAQRTRFDGVYAQVQRTAGGFALQGAIRFDRAWSWFPAAQIGPTRFLPNPITFPETTGVDAYTDISPRMGVVYDSSATRGRRSRSTSAGISRASTGRQRPTAARTHRRVTTTVNRAWTDANANFVPDCDLLNPALQDLRPAAAISADRSPTRVSEPRHSATRTIRRCCRAGACGRRTGPSACRCSRNWPAARRSRRDISAGG